MVCALLKATMVMNCYVVIGGVYYSLTLNILTNIYFWSMQLNDEKLNMASTIATFFNKLLVLVNNYHSNITRLYLYLHSSDMHVTDIYILNSKCIILCSDPIAHS